MTKRATDFSNKTTFSFAYPEDLKSAYAFYCARYKDMSFSEFLELPLSEFMAKMQSMPETEPLYKIIQSRVVEISKIKDKEERDRWRELKRANAIPEIYLSLAEIDSEVMGKIINIKELTQ